MNTPRTSRQQQDDLAQYLLGRGWTRASDCARALSTSERAIRARASQSRGTILSGQQGYRLTSESSPADVVHAAAHLRSRARELLTRASEIERAAQAAPVSLYDLFDDAADLPRTPRTPHTQLLARAPDHRTPRGTRLE
jgi:hypothetical protein